MAHVTELPVVAVVLAGDASLSDSGRSRPCCWGPVGQGQERAGGWPAASRLTV